MGMWSYASRSLKFLFYMPAVVGVRLSSRPASVGAAKQIDGSLVLLHYQLRKQRFLIDPDRKEAAGLFGYAGAAEVVWNLSPRSRGEAYSLLVG